MDLFLADQNLALVGGVALARVYPQRILRILQDGKWHTLSLLE